MYINITPSDSASVTEPRLIWIQKVTMTSRPDLCGLTVLSNKSVTTLTQLKKFHHTNDCLPFRQSNFTHC